MSNVPLNPWLPENDRVALAHLGKLAEELGEASAAVSRCIIQGIDESEPVTGKPNRKMLEEELADVIANIHLVIHYYSLDHIQMDIRAAKKKEHLRSWHKLINEAERQPQ